METAPDDAENLNAAFRAAHTIKGTAGLFGCDAVVLFTHEVETLLEGCAPGLLVTEQISAALLEGRDQMAGLDRRGAQRHVRAPRWRRAARRWGRSCAGCMARRLGGGPDAPAAAPAGAARRRSAAPEAPVPGTCRCASVPTRCATGWTRWPSCATCRTLGRCWPATPWPTRCRARAAGRRILLPGLRAAAAAPNAATPRSKASSSSPGRLQRAHPAARRRCRGLRQALLQERAAGDEEPSAGAAIGCGCRRGEAEPTRPRPPRPDERPPLPCRPARPRRSERREPAAVPTAAAAAATAWPATRPASSRCVPTSSTT
jgi:chemotaxis protein histidine kinase CheA